MLVTGSRRAEAIEHDGARTRHEHRQELGADRHSLVAKIGIARRRRLPQHGEQSDHRAERRRAGGPSSQPIEV
jgi:hypothetical protein